MKLDPGTTVERYVVEEILGAGGTAMVYLVRHTSLGTRHALKVLTLTSSAIRQRMLREGKVQAAMNHPNVVSVTDVIDIDGQPGLLMEYVVGPSLERALSKYKLTMGDAEILFQGIVAGVRAAHDAGLVHRDLKPANVLLQRTQAGFVPKVTDFGLAKLLAADPEVAHTRSGIAMGTPSYMAPEQIRDARSVDQRADVWSLGCLLYELMTRRRTFPGDEALAIYNAVTEGRFLPPREIVTVLPDRIEMAIHGCLTVDREDRIPDCETLEEVLRGERPWALPDFGDDYADTPTRVVPRASPLPSSGVVQRAEPPGVPVRARTTGGGDHPASAGGSSAGGGGERRSVRSGGSSTGGGLTTGGFAAPVEEATDVPRMPPPIDPGMGDDAETVLVSRSSIDGTLLPENAHIGSSLDDGDDDAGTPWWVYLLLGTGALAVGLLFLFAFGAAVMSTVLTERVGVDDATRPVDAGEPTPDPEPASKGASTPPEPAPASPAPKVQPAASPEPEPAPEPSPSSAPSAPKPSPSPAPSAPKPAPSPAPTAAPAPAPAPAPSAAPQPTVDEAGRVRVVFGSTPPGADLWVGGFKRSRTPASIDLPPGAYEVMMQQRGGSPSTFTVQVKAGEPTNWCYDFAAGNATMGSCPTLGPGSFTR